MCSSDLGGHETYVRLPADVMDDVEANERCECERDDDGGGVDVEGKLGRLADGSARVHEVLLLGMCEECGAVSAMAMSQKKTHGRSRLRGCLGDRGALRGASRSGPTNTGATEHATSHATERSSVRELHVIEPMGRFGESQVTHPAFNCLRHPRLPRLRFQFSVTSGRLPVLSARAN